VNQLTFDFAKAELQKLEVQCAQAFEAGSIFHPTREGDAQHLVWMCWEYHRLSEARREARERIQLHEMRLQRPANDTTGTPVNDTVPSRSAELPHR
jgi:hypothetical protein